MALAVLLMQPAESAAAVEETFDVLQIGTKTYKNVTVTTKAKNYIFILHSAGMTNIKIAELPPDLREKLGYVEKAKAGAKTRLPGRKRNWLNSTCRNSSNWSNGSAGMGRGDSQ